MPARAGGGAGSSTRSDGAKSFAILESTRRHERLTPRALGGTVRTFPGPGGKPVELWVPDRSFADPAAFDTIAPWGESDDH